MSLLQTFYKRKEKNMLYLIHFWMGGVAFKTFQLETMSEDNANMAYIDVS